MRNMKILYFCPSEGMYGDNQALLRIMPLLIEKGVEPHFIIADSGPLEDYLCVHKFKYKIVKNRIWNWYLLNYPVYHWVKTAWKTRILKCYKNMCSINNVSKYVIDNDIDIIHTNCTNSSLGFYVAKKTRKPHIWHIREYGDLDTFNGYFPSKSSFRKKLTYNNNFCIAITPQIQSHFEIENCSELIYDGVFDQNVIPSIEKNKKNFFLFVGRLTPTKGVHRVIESFIRTAPTHNYRLVIAGSGDENYENTLKQKVAINGLEDRVDFLGFSDKVSALMQESSAIIICSESEAFGFITAEAMYNGCFVIGHNTAGTKLQFDNILHSLGYESFLRYNTDDELDQCMMKIVSDGKFKVSHLAETQKAVLEMYSIQKAASKTLDFYNKIASEK